MVSPGVVIASRFRVVAPLGQGGQGRVVRALDLARGREVALKIVAAHALDAVVAELEVATRLVHPSLARIADVGRTRVGDREIAWIASELIEGVSLARFAVGARWASMERAIVSALEGLAALHGAGLRHGDARAENVLVAADGRAVWVDLGLAGALGSALRGATPGLVAPELVRGARDVDGRGDLYALASAVRALLPALADPVPYAARAVIDALAHDDPARRPDAAEALAKLGARAHAVDTWPSALVGRDAELDTLDALVARVSEGAAGARVVRIVGPSGSGRTALLSRFRWRCGLRAEIVEPIAGALGDAIARAAGREGAVRGVADALAAIDRASGRGRACVIVIDDADRLAADARSLLDAITRALDPRGPLAIAIATSEGDGLALAPLGAREVGSWLGSRLEPDAIDALTRASDGLPGRIVAILDALRGAHVDRAAIAESARRIARSGVPLDASTAERASAMSIAAAGGLLDDGEADALGLDAARIAALVARGWARRERASTRLVVPAEDVLASARPAERRAAFLALAATAARDPSPQRAIVERARRLAEAGELEEASALLLGHPDAPWDRERAAIVARASGRADVLLVLARIEERTGRPDLALGTIARALRTRPDAAMRAKAREAAASAYLRRGDGARALRVLARAAGRDGRHADLVARASIQVGRYDEARRIAEDALRLDALDDTTRAELLEDVGVAAGYLGDRVVAERALAEAEPMRRHDDPRARVRVASYRAIHAYRAGELEAAAARYREALAIAEEHALDDQLASAALNLGTTEHQRGELGGAREAYERALRLAHALGRVRTHAVALFDRAQLLADAGASARAEIEASAALDAARSGGLDAMVACCLELRGTLALGRGDLDEAARLAGEAIAIADRVGATRERAELAILEAEIALARGALDEATSHVERARQSAADARDLVAKSCATAARIELARERPERALGAAEEGLAALGASGARDVEAELAALAARAAEGAGAPATARPFRERARAIWERAALTLPASERAAFWAAPKRRELGAIERAVTAASARERWLERLLAVNARLTSSLRATDVLEVAMDAAIELTGGERGFVLLADREGGELRVAAARHVDRRRVDRAWLEWSRSIAERVIASGEPILSAEATEDARFAEQRSVRALGLRSVLAVPIRGRGGALGALYLDHRFARGSFAEGGVGILVAFADQVAIALENARLHEELAARTRELERERRRIASSLDEKGREIERLEDTIRTMRGAGPDARYEELGLIGRSEAIRALLARVDRVAPAGLPVLITGESGTGKELVARALHRFGPTPEGPMISINCAALPATLLESELFGHARGAFTGADRDRVGLFVRASGGTLFLDEIGELPLALQAKLLRALQEREVRPLGASRSVAFSARVIAATHRDLRADVAAQRFREDLFYRLAVVEVAVPPLRERLEDLPLLAAHVIARLARETRREPAPRPTPAALRALSRHAWPGNVRELENVLASAMVQSEGPRIDARDLALDGGRTTAPSSRRVSRRDVDDREAARVASALEASGFNVSEVCRTLGIPRTTLYRKLKRWGIEPGPRPLR
ncbi:two component, sigma54 specific, transcriptional regulator, Fis family [Sandaracinus amylolyticus]|uniref:Two component, sigma54 specific, transcriptional regulator, Fis family n=1 Tax=Sandaracinus amylolyticus TaxID=927083 RepID=A0A0F6VYS5_9BACT|nr:two component, sigma54 specific, transcriptional regulator, Fis family [Sandaracinus amylolyticus]